MLPVMRLPGTQQELTAYQIVSYQQGHGRAATEMAGEINQPAVLNAPVIKVDAATQTDSCCSQCCQCGLFQDEPMQGETNEVQGVMERELWNATSKVVSLMTHKEVVDAIIGQCRFFNESEARVVLMELNHLRLFMGDTFRRLDGTPKRIQFPLFSSEPLPSSASPNNQEPVHTTSTVVLQASQSTQLPTSTIPSTLQDPFQSLPSLAHLTPSTSQPSPPTDQSPIDPPSIPAFRMPTLAEFHTEYRAQHQARFGPSFQRFIDVVSSSKSSDPPPEAPAPIPTIVDVHQQIVSRRQEVNNRRNPNGLLDLAYFIDSDGASQAPTHTFLLLPAWQQPCPIYPFIDPVPEVLRFNSEQRERIRQVNKALKLALCDSIGLCAGGYTLIEVYEIVHDLLNGVLQLIRESAGPETTQMRDDGLHEMSNYFKMTEEICEQIVAVLDDVSLILMKETSRRETRDTAFKGEEIAHDRVADQIEEFDRVLRFRKNRELEKEIKTELQSQESEQGSSYFAVPEIPQATQYTFQAEDAIPMEE